MNRSVAGSASQKMASSVSASSWNRSSSLTRRALPSASEAMCAMPRASETSWSENEASSDVAVITSAPNPSGSHRVGATRTSVDTSPSRYSGGTSAATALGITNGSSIAAMNRLPRLPGMVVSAGMRSVPCCADNSKSPVSGSRW